MVNTECGGCVSYATRVVAAMVADGITYHWITIRPTLVTPFAASSSHLSHTEPGRPWDVDGSHYLPIIRRDTIALLAGASIHWKPFSI